MLDLSPLVSAIPPIVEKLKELLEYQSSSREKLYENRYKPLFETLQIVHHDYCVTFSSMHRHLKDSIALRRENEAVSEALRALENARPTYIGQRQVIIANARGLQKDKLSREEQEFLAKVLSYFVPCEPGNSSLEAMLETERPYATYYSTMENLFQASGDVFGIKDAVSNCQNNIESAFSSASNSMVSLRIWAKS